MKRLVVLLLLLGAISCAGKSDGSGSAAPLRNEVSTAPVAPARSDASQAPRIVVLGDSLTAGLGLDPRDAYPAVLQRIVTDHGYSFEVVNAGVSGDTSSDGLRRLRRRADVRR